ncbi:MAG: hypothetical protein SGILL_006400, partial [Bacillariaceae sp.]
HDGAQQQQHWTHNFTNHGLNHALEGGSGPNGDGAGHSPPQGGGQAQATTPPTETPASAMACPSTCLDIMQGYNYKQVQPIKTDDIVSAVPLTPDESHLFVYQNPYQCGLDLFVVHDSETDTDTGGQVLMKFEGIDMTNATLKSGDAQSSRIIFDKTKDTTEVFWEWKRNGDGMATEWIKEQQPTVGSCFQVSSAKFIKGMEYWRFIAGPVDADGNVDEANHMYLDKDEPVTVCVATCGSHPGASLPQKPTLPSSGNNKTLVIYAGPHETAGNQVVEFLSDSAKPGGAMDGWIWPTIEINDNIVNHPFGYYVRKQQDETVRNAVFDGIQTAWDQSEHGVVIGASEFDKVGVDPFSGSNAIEAILQLVSHLGIAPSDVTIALTYRSPRISHWAAVQKHFDFATYEEFVCAADEDRNRWEWLDTAINPMKLATAYIDMGWKVDIIDYEGTARKDFDVAHQIACEVMSHVECEGGWVKGLKDVKSAQLNTDNTMSVLSPVQRKDLEDMFLARDCYYKYFLNERQGFDILNRHQTWKTCEAQHLTYYNAFTNTDFLTNAMKSQVSCSVEPLDVHDVVTSKMLPKQNSLVLLAGPRESSDAEITQFFAEHTTSSFLRDPNPSFSGWQWPRPSSAFLKGKTSFDVYDLLVSFSEDTVIQNLLLDTIRDSWNQQTKGVIIGSSNFERVGHNPLSGYDPLRVLKRVVDGVRVPPEDVTVVLNYRAPRVYQWNALFEKHFSAKSYNHFLCSEDEFEKRWEFLDTVMNPLKVAASYRTEGYKVTVIDEAGVLEDGKDVAHSLACNVMDGVRCTNDWVNGLEDDKIETFNSNSLTGLTETQWAVLEEYFQARDCYYMYTLAPDERFNVLHQRELWKSCQQPGDYAEVQYQDLVDTNFFLDLLRSQVNCSTGSASDISDIWTDGKNNDTENDNQLIIIMAASVSGLVVAILFVICCVRRRRTKRSKKLEEEPSDGVFVSDPHLYPSSKEIVENFRNSSAYMDDDEAPLPPSPSAAPPAMAFLQDMAELDGQGKKSFESVEMEDDESARKSPVLSFV